MNISPSNTDAYEVTMSYLYDERSVKDTVAHRLEPFHVLKYLSHSHVLRINDPKGCHVYEIVLEVFKVERFDVLQKQGKCTRSQ
jgi:hypothetical protein